jgi:5'-nucleotidase
MKILVTNDDGIHAPGLWALAAQLTRAGEVVVCAPDREQSGTGTAITLHRSVKLTEVDSPVASVKAYAVEGTPGDSVLLALRMLENVAMVFSGINRGANMGHDVLLSGTVGAALQGYFHGVPSVAISVEAGHAGEATNFEVAARLAPLLAASVNLNGAGPLLLNVNLPNLPLENIGGIDITKVGTGGYSTAISMGRDGGRDDYRITIGKPWWSFEEGTDIHAVDRRRISITPLRGELSTARELVLPEDLPAVLFRDL